jgi:hypothetical protein
LAHPATAINDETARTGLMMFDQRRDDFIGTPARSFMLLTVLMGSDRLSMGAGVTHGT